jgi:hypothetical protein
METVCKRIQKTQATQPDLCRPAAAVAATWWSAACLLRPVTKQPSLPTPPPCTLRSG